MVNVSIKKAMSRKVQHKYGLVTNPERGNMQQAILRNKKKNKHENIDNLFNLLLFLGWPC